VREKEEWLLGANGTALSAGATHCESHLWFVKDFRLYGSSDGVVLSQEAIRSWAEVRPSIVDSQAGKHAERKTLIPPQACGYELLEKFPPTEIEIATEHAKMKLKSPTVRSGTKDLVIAPSNLWLTIHETVGHSTESDRILGFEANFAGTTFVKPVDIGHLVFGSPLVNFTADRTSTNGLASSGFDDEGIPTSKFQLVKDGILVDVPTSSDTARILGFERSNGCAFCETAGRIPILRMPNISLEPGARACSLENLISAVEDGLLVIGDDCWSIDQKRHQFQFSAQELWEIRRGRITNLVKDGAYHGRTREFWSSLTALGDASTVGSGGTFFCGKGEPLQASPVSHGAPAALFRNVEVSQLGTAR
jgi:TldD protein